MPESSTRGQFAHREVGAVAAVVGLLLLVFSGRYGYHRDELYFLEAGRHLAWGYPDQPPLIPLLARIMDTIAPGSLVMLRVPSDLAAAGMVALSGWMAAALEARRTGQVTAAVATGLSGLVLGTGHLLSTSTFMLLGWTAVTALLLKVLLRGGGVRAWLLLGLVAGLTAQANVLVLALVAAFGVSLLAVGPRDLLRTPAPYAGAVLALAVAAPYLVWQIGHGLPQLDVARSIASGGSGSSASRWSFVPLVLLQVGPTLAPLWITGLVCLFRRRPLRSLAISFVLLAVLFLVAGGKPYYLGGNFALLLAAGAQPFVDRVWRWVVPALLVAALPVVVIVLPVLPARDAGPAVAVNYDAGETIGWPAYVDRIAAAYRRLPAGTAILTQNYGEAGAVDRYGPRHGLPSAHSGHNAFGLWDPPPGSVPVLAVGVDRSVLRRSCTGIRDLGRLHDVDGIDNDENGAPLVFCVGPTRPWAALWSRFVHLG